MILMIFLVIIIRYNFIFKIKEALRVSLILILYGSEIPFANSNRNINIDNGIINVMFERILNTFTVIFLDLTPKINDTINPMSIKT